MVRKYDPEYIKYRFTNSETNLESKPQCVKCAQIWSNKVLKSSKFQRHFTSKHPEVTGKPKEYFAKKESMQRQQGILTSFTTQSKAALKQAIWLLFVLLVARKHSQ